MATDKQVLANLDFEAKAPAIMCMAGGAGLYCPSQARHSITCMDHGRQIFLCSLHRLVFRPEEIVCGDTWYEAVIA